MGSNVSQKGNFVEVFLKFCFFISWEEISTESGQNKFQQVKKVIFFGDSKSETLEQY